MGKMTMNGGNMHPLIKYLKRNCESFYENRGVGANPISQKIGIFVHNENKTFYFKITEINEIK